VDICKAPPRAGIPILKRLHETTRIIVAALAIFAVSPVLA